MSLETKISIKDFNFYYDSSQALQNINLDIQPKQIFTVFGPARSGKTTLLKSLNRLTDLIFGTSHTGAIFLDESDIYDPKMDLRISGDASGWFLISQLLFPCPSSTILLMVLN